jgi:CSLREA domain-containing protein
MAYRLFSIAAVCIVFSLQSHAETQQAPDRMLVVTTFQDEIRDDASCSLREAWMLSQKVDVTSAEARFNGCFLPAGEGTVHIQLAKGTYVLSIPNTENILARNAQGVAYSGAETDPSKGDLDISPYQAGYVCRDVFVSGVGSSETLLDANHTNRFFDVTKYPGTEPCNVHLRIQHMTLQHGLASEMSEENTFPSAQGRGGAIDFYVTSAENPSGTLELSNVVFKENSSSHIIADTQQICQSYPSGTSTNPTKWNLPGMGGGVFFAGNHLSIKNSVYLRNTSGKIACTPETSTTLPYRTSWGGALVVFLNSYGQRSLLIENTVFDANTSGDIISGSNNNTTIITGMGGAVAVFLNEAVNNATNIHTLQRNIFRNNVSKHNENTTSCYQGGGALSVSTFSNRTSPLLIKQNVFHQNTGGHGSSLLFNIYAKGLLLNNTFYNNHTIATNGSLIATCDSSSTDIVASTFMNNTGGSFIINSNNSQISYSYVQENTAVCSSQNIQTLKNVFKNKSCGSASENYLPDMWLASENPSYNEHMLSFPVNLSDLSFRADEITYKNLKLLDGHLVVSDTSQPLQDDQYARHEILTRTTPGAVETPVSYEAKKFNHAKFFRTKEPSSACPNDVVLAINTYYDTDQNGLLDTNERYADGTPHKEVCLNNQYTLSIQPSQGACQGITEESHTCERSTHTVSFSPKNTSTPAILGHICICEGEPLPSQTSNNKEFGKLKKHGCGCSNTDASLFVYAFTTACYMFVKKRPRKIKQLP